jgi:hypothetical protein
MQVTIGERLGLETAQQANDREVAEHLGPDYSRRLRGEKPEGAVEKALARPVELGRVSYKGLVSLIPGGVQDDEVSE